MKTLILAALLLAASPAFAADAPRPSWRDDDHDCQSTRTEVIIRDCREVVLSANGCTVAAAVCVDLYTGADITTDTPAQSIQIDHLFPYAEARTRKRWSKAALANFFNDQLNLVAVRARTNGQKSDRMPGEWCPSDARARPEVARRFRAVVKRRYAFALTASEEAGVRAWERGECMPGDKVVNGLAAGEAVAAIGGAR